MIFHSYVSLPEGNSPTKKYRPSPPWNLPNKWGMYALIICMECTLLDAHPTSTLW